MTPPVLFFINDWCSAGSLPKEQNLELEFESVVPDDRDVRVQQSIGNQKMNSDDHVIISEVLIVASDIHDQSRDIGEPTERGQRCKNDASLRNVHLSQSTFMHSGGFITGCLLHGFTPVGCWNG